MTGRPAALVVTEPLGGSPLSRAIQDRALPEGLQPWFPAHSADWSEHVARVREGTAGRGGGAWYAALEEAITPSGDAERRLRRVVAERGIVITTGQQPGLFGGPLYTLSKAITALTLAESIEERTGVPAAPVFWAATDDADFLEARSAHVADGEGLRTLALSREPPPGTMMARAPLAAGEIAALTAQLRKTCGSAPHARFLELAVEAFATRKTLGGAYVAMLRDLLEPLGVAVLDAGHDAYRAAARPVLLEALERAGAIEQALATRAADIRRAGYDVQVDDDRGLSLVFEVTDGVKRRIAIAEAARMASGGAALSPNVLLRPIVERELLPTAAYIGGPGEIAYFVQSNAVASCLGREPLVIAPRWSCTVIEPFVSRAVDRLGVDWREVQDLHALERRLAQRALPPEVAATWKALRSRLHEDLASFRSTVREHELLPDAVLDGLERSLDHRLSRGERRLLAAVKRREEGTRRDLAVASGALFPHGKRQERVLNFVPMLARGGPALLAEMRRAAGVHATALLGARSEAPVTTP